MAWFASLMLRHILKAPLGFSTKPKGLTQLVCSSTSWRTSSVRDSSSFSVKLAPLLKEFYVIAERLTEHSRDCVIDVGGWVVGLLSWAVSRAFHRLISQARSGLRILHEWFPSTKPESFGACSLNIWNLVLSEIFPAIWEVWKNVSEFWKSLELLWIHPCQTDLSKSAKVWESVPNSRKYRRDPRGRLMQFLSKMNIVTL